MLTTIGKVRRTLATGLCLLGALASAAEPQNAEEDTGRWERLPVPAGQIVTDPGGLLWTVSDGKLKYWDGSQLRPAIYADEPPPKTQVRLHGDRDRGAYAVWQGKGHRGLVYRLSDGKVSFVTNIYCDNFRVSTGFYPAKSGQLFNWGDRFVAVLRKGKWERRKAKLSLSDLVICAKSGQLFNWGDRIVAVLRKGKWERREAKLSLSDLVICDAGRTVYFYYDDRIFAVTADGKITERHVPELAKYVYSGRPQHRAVGALWGADKMMVGLAGRHDGLSVYDLTRNRLLDATELNIALKGPKIHSIVRALDGAAWIRASGLNYRVSPQGVVSLIDEPAAPSRGIEGVARYGQGVLSASDGSMWFGLDRGAVGRWKDGQWRVFDWQDNLTSSRTYQLLEGDRGKIYLRSSTGLFVFHPIDTPAPLSPGLALWEEYKLNSHGLIPDANGNIWMFLKDRPGFASRWDGERWHHREMPFDTARVGRAMSDDRGHVLLYAGDYGLGWFDIGPDSVERHPDIRYLLVDAVSKGARRFWCDDSFQGCHVLEGGKIWCGWGQSAEFDYYDGQRWDTFRMPARLKRIFKSPAHGIIFVTQGGRHYTYDRGQIVEVDVDRDAGTRWLLGPRGIQPFEEELLAENPALYVPLEKGRWDGSPGYSLLVTTPDPCVDADARPDYGKGQILKQSVAGTLPARRGGRWIDTGGGMPLYRLLGGQVFQCDFTGTRLEGEGSSVRCAIEDNAGNVWFDVRNERAFVKKLDQFRVELGETPPKVKRAIDIPVKVVLPGLDPEQGQVFWRLWEGDWQAAGSGGPITVRFSQPGTYRIEVLAMDPQGCTTPQPATVIVEAEVPLPQTLPLAEGPFEVKDVVWSPPVEMVPSEPDQVPRLAYRIDGSAWTTLPEGDAVPMGGLEEGFHVVELAAFEEPCYRDRSPVGFQVTYVPDFEFIVESRLEALGAEDEELASKARSEIATAGPEVIPILSRKLEEARRRRAGIATAIERARAELRKSEAEPRRVWDDSDS